MTSTSRRGFLGTAAAAALTTTIPTATAAAGTGAVWGVGDVSNLDSGWASYIAALEQKQGRRFAGVRLNAGFSNPQAAFTEIDKDIQAGRRWVYLNGKPQPPTGSYTGYWKAVAAGQYDSDFHTFIQHVMADTNLSTTRPLHYSFHHEQQVSSEGGGSQAGSATDYAAAWNHVARLIDQAGAHVSQGGKLVRCWTPHWLQVSRDPAYAVSSQKAGSNVSPFLATKILNAGLDLSKLDLVGADIYCTTTTSCTADDQWTPLHRLATHLGLPFYTGETGIAGSDTKVVAWLRRLDTLLHGWGAGSGAGQLLAVCWTSRVASGGDYRLDATANRLAQYRSMAQDTFYGAVAA